LASTTGVVNLRDESLPRAKKACPELAVALSEQKPALSVVEWVEGVAEGAKDLNRKVTALSLKCNISSFYIPCLSREYLSGFDTKGSLAASSIFPLICIVHSIQNLLRGSATLTQTINGGARVVGWGLPHQFLFTLNHPWRGEGLIPRVL